MSWSRKEYLRQNEIRINKICSKYYAGVCLLPYLVLLMVVLGLFNFSLTWSIVGVVLSSSLAVVYGFLAKKQIYAKSFKYLICLGVQCVMLIYCTDLDMNVTVMYMMSPIVALLYFDPKFELITCIVSILAMFIGIIIQAPVTVTELYHPCSPLMFVLTTGGAHFFEMVVVTVIFVMVTMIVRGIIDLVCKRNEEIESIQNNLVFSFADMIESRDGTTGEHVKRTSKIVSLIANVIKKNPELYNAEFVDRELELIVMSAPLHDIGKMKVPDSILSKPGKLTPEEYNIIKTHSTEGAKIIDRTMTKIEDPLYVGIARAMALCHHEKWDGSGYPKGLSGNDIPVCARIMAVADVFDALCSKRSYKDPYTIEEAFNIMNESKGSHFEPALVDILNQLKPEMEDLYSNNTSQEEAEELLY